MNSQQAKDYEGVSYSPARLDVTVPRIAARLFNTPLLLHPEKAQAIAWALRDKLGLQNLAEPALHTMQAAGFGDSMDHLTGYYVEGNVAVIPVHGTLVNRGAWLGTYSGMTSYQGLTRQIDMARKDSRVEAVMLDIDSYGGEASGVDDLAESIHAMNKPVYAMIDGYGTSAAYWIAAAADKVFIAQSSHGGSIGVVLTHYDATAKAEKEGVTVTHIYAGRDKVLGSPWMSLSDSDREKLQASVDKTYSAFVSAMSGFRGIDTEAIRATEAGVFAGSEMIDVGLADGITTGRRLLAAIQHDPSNPDFDRDFNSGASRATTRGTTMSEAPQAGGSHETAYTEAQMSARVQEAIKIERASAEQQVTEARKAERDRVSAILSCDEAADRPTAAMKVAMSTDMDVDAAKAFLTDLATEAKTGGLAAAMAGNSPGISADAGDADMDPHEAAAQFILNA